MRLDPRNVGISGLQEADLQRRLRWGAMRGTRDACQALEGGSLKN